MSRGLSSSVPRLPRQTPPDCSVCPLAAVRRAPGLLRLRNRDGRPVYPVVQFADSAQLPGVAEVVTALTPALQPLTIASWLTGPNRNLGDRRPVDVLRDGDPGRVLQLARQLAGSAGS